LDGLKTTPITWETGMSKTKKDDTLREPLPLDLGWSQGTSELAERLEGYIEQKASGRIRDLHVVCSDGGIILQGRSRTYHAKQLAQQAVLDLTDEHTLLTNQIVVC
jgi:osmotically-inducible protein OsmY